MGSLGDKTHPGQMLHLEEDLVTDQDVTAQGLGHVHNARTQVDIIANGGILRALQGTHITQNHFATVNTHLDVVKAPLFLRVICTERGQMAHHLHRSQYGRLLGFRVL